MSKAGQNPFTGISAQTDIALLYLLKTYKKPSFKRMIVEGLAWEDFTLEFSDYTENFEVKWHSKPITYSQILPLIQKEIKRSYKKKDLFYIVAKSVSISFLNDFQYIKNRLYLWGLQKSEKDYTKNKVIQRFIKKGWSEQEIAFLLKTNIIIFKTESEVSNLITEHFIADEVYYFSPGDRRNAVGRFFTDIIKAGAKGSSIEQKTFSLLLEQFKQENTAKSESFNQDIALGEKRRRVKAILKSKKDFRELIKNQDSLLGPISAHPILIHDIFQELKNSTFRTGDFSGLLEKIFIKRSYVWLAVDLLKDRWKKSLAEPEFIIDFIIKHFPHFFALGEHTRIIGLLSHIAKTDISQKYRNQILRFFSKNMHTTFEYRPHISVDRQDEHLRRDKTVAGILEFYWEQDSNKTQLVEYIFANYDLTADDYGNFETHQKIYRLLSQYLLLNPSKNFQLVLNKIVNQYDRKYGIKYKGCEFVGGGVSQAGSSYSISDIGIVRDLFSQFFNEVYKKDPKKGWSFLVDKVLKNHPKTPSRMYPLFLFRSLIGLLLKRVSSSSLTRKEKKESWSYLKAILRLKQGIPSTSEILFNQIRSHDLKGIEDDVMALVRIDGRKYKKPREEEMPTNLFTISTVFKLIVIGYSPAEDFFLQFLKHPDFNKYDRHFQTFEQLSASDIPKSKPSFVLKVLHAVNLKRYLDQVGEDIVWDKTGMLIDVIKAYWNKDLDDGPNFLISLLDNNPSEKILEFVGSVIGKLSEHDPIKTFNMIEKYLGNKETFFRRFGADTLFREQLIILAQELAKIGEYEHCKKIIELTFDDPDPNTDSLDRFNYHSRIKKGEDEIIIAGVRGKVAWALKQFVASLEPVWMEYAFKKVEILLDLDANLARSIGYSTPDYYVRLQAMVPLIELAHPKKRERIPHLDVKSLSFRLMEETRRDFIERHDNPRSILKRLTHLFSYFRDLNTEEAKKVLSMFENHQEEGAYFLFIYFAVFRENNYPEIPFKSAYFIDQLRALCKTQNVFRKEIAFSIWRDIMNKGDNAKEYFGRVEEFWKLLFERYEPNVYDELFRVLSVTIKWPEKYTEHVRLLKEALKTQGDYLRDQEEMHELWGPRREIAEYLIDKDVGEFLSVFELLLDTSSPKVHYFDLIDWVGIYRTISLKSFLDHKRLERVNRKLFDLGYIEDH